MPAPLVDITLYYEGPNIKDAPDDWAFRRTANFICDFYHQMLFGYKPPKTTRICIHIGEGTNLEQPIFFGSVCSISNAFDDDKYVCLPKNEQYKYVLDTIHSACMRIAEQLEWNKEVFLNAFNEVQRRDFSFYLDYPIKKSQGRQKSAFVKVVKTELHSILYVNIIDSEEVKSVKLFEKTNHFWYDSIYDMAKNSKWFTLSTFGVTSKKSGKYIYYSLVDNAIIGNLDNDGNATRV